MAKGSLAKDLCDCVVAIPLITYILSSEERGWEIKEYFIFSMSPTIIFKLLKSTVITTLENPQFKFNINAFKLFQKEILKNL